MPSAMVTFNGRITLPADVRKKLGLRTGDRVEFVQLEGGGFSIAPGVQSSTEPNSDPKDWFPDQTFEPTEDEPRFKQADEVLQ